MDGTRSLVLNGELMLYGIVDPFEFFGEGDTIRAIDVMASLGELSGRDTIIVRINSPGGSVVEGLAIYNALRASGKRIEVHVDAMAASIASIIAMAGDEIVMAENATIMIHDPYGAAFGGAETLREVADEIDRQKTILVNIYAKRTGLGAAEIESLMAAETYMGAAEAVERGFADRVDEPIRVAALAPLNPQMLARLLAPQTLRAAQRPSPAAPAAQPVETMRMDPTQNQAVGENAATPSTALPPAAASPPETQRAPAVDMAAVRAEAVRMERERVANISSAVRAARIDPTFADELIREGVTADVARERIINRWADTQNQAQDNAAPARTQVPEGGDGLERWAQGATAGLLARASLKGGERNEFTGLTLSELARSALNVRNIRNGHMDRMSMVGAAFTIQAAGPGYHSTSDFGSVLSNVAYRAMMTGYEEVDETFPLWTGKGTAADFRPISRVDLGLFPALDKVEEGAEYKYGTIGDTGTTVQIATYGKMFAITRQAVINDDLGFFDRVPRRMGRAAKRTIGNLVYAIVNGNPTMQDGVALFHATHGNLAGSAAVLSVTSVGAAQAAMARQKDEAGIGTSVGVRSKYLLVPPELLMTANTVMTSERIPGDAGQVQNPVRGTATPISDSRLSGTAWYLAGDPAQVDTIEVTYLDGVEEPFMDQREGWNVDGTEFKVRMDAGVKALHWRGLYKNAGA